MDRISAAAQVEAERFEFRTSPKYLLERLTRLEVTQRAYALTWGMMAPRSKEDRRWIRGHFEKHQAAAKCLRRRIGRLVRRGLV